MWRADALAGRSALAALLLASACSQLRLDDGACDEDDPGSCRASVHAPGILDPGSPEFHGNLLQSYDFDYGVCAACHGEDFGGGGSGVACTRCHSEAAGPKACSTCHSHI